MLTLLFLVALVGAKSVPQEKDHPEFLFFKNGTDVWQIKITGETGNAKKLINNTVDYDIDEKHERVFWYDEKGNFYQRNIHSNDSEKKLMFQYPFKTRKFAFSYDVATDKLYILDNELKRIVASDPSGRNQTVLSERDPILKEAVAGSQRLIKVVLDTEAGLMFIKLRDEFRERIYRSNMDGTSTKLIIPLMNDSLAFDVNREKKRIVLEDNQGSLSSFDYDGNDKKLVIKKDNLLTTTTYNDRYFWSHTNFGPEGLYYCKLLSSQECAEPVRVKLDALGLERPDSLRVLRPSARAAVDQSCAASRCGQACLLTSAGPTCACHLGWEAVDREARECRPVVPITNTTTTETLKRSKRQGDFYYDLYHPQSTMRPDPPTLGGPNLNFPPYLMFIG